MRGGATPSSAPMSEAKVKSGEAKVKVISELEMIAEPTEEVNGERSWGTAWPGAFANGSPFSISLLPSSLFSVLRTHSQYVFRMLADLCV